MSAAAAAQSGPPKGSLVAVVTRAGKIDGVRTDDDEDGGTTGSDLLATGEVATQVQVNRRHGEDSNARVCNLLIEKLNQDGASWGPCVNLRASSRTEEGVDCVAYEGANTLKMQVTRATPDQGLWRAVDPSSPVNRTLTVEEHADELRVAIERKRYLASKADIVLVLDALQTAHGLPPVVECFKNQHGPWARNVGFKAIWVVGPCAALVSRLDQ